MSPAALPQNTIAAITPTIPTIIPIVKFRPAKPFTMCSAAKLLVDSKEGEMFSSISVSVCSLNADDGQPQFVQDEGTEFSSKTFPQSGQQ